MSKTLKQDNTPVVALIVSYENRKSIIFKVLCVVVYFVIEKNCVDYLGLQRKTKLSSSHRNFEDNSFEELSVIGIPEILFNIVSCYGFFQDKNSTLIFTCRSKLVSY